MKISVLTLISFFQFISLMNAQSVRLTRDNLESVKVSMSL